jgi:hypothetical protein
MVMCQRMSVYTSMELGTARAVRGEELLQMSVFQNHV